MRTPRVLRQLVRSLPPIKRREEELARQRRELAHHRSAARMLRAEVARQRSVNTRQRETISTLRSTAEAYRAELARAEDVHEASYRVALRQHVRVIRAQRAANRPAKHPAIQLRYKLYIYELAMSHGIPVPEVYNVWPHTASIDLTSLPDEFVLKADGGSNGRSVLPLQRVGHDHYRRIGTDKIYTSRELRKFLDALGRQALAPYFAEELLRSVDGRSIPDDVKVYMFHGVMGQALLRSGSQHVNRSVLPARFVDASGNDFGPVPVGRPYDPDIPLPQQLGALIEVARHASRAVGLPFCRVDLYETTRGPVLGEITAAPSSGKEKFTPEHDAQLGRLWIDATVRLEEDLHNGRPPGVIFGESLPAHHYPESDDPASARNFTRFTRACHEWC